MTTTKSPGTALPAPAPLVAEPIVVGFETPQLNDSISIHLMCCSSVDSPSTPSSFRNMSTAAIAALPERERELPAREACRGPFDVGAGDAGVPAGAADDDVGVVRADADDRPAGELERLHGHRTRRRVELPRIVRAVLASATVHDGPVRQAHGRAPRARLR